MVATVSSRTPEGVPYWCPICHSNVCVEPSLLTRDAPCPECGCLLWFGDRPERTFYLGKSMARKAGLRTRLAAQRIVATLLFMELLRHAGTKALAQWFRGIVRRIRRIRSFPERAARVPAEPQGAKSGLWDPWLDAHP